jgi:hypothetical protein
MDVLRDRCDNFDIGGRSSGNFADDLDRRAFGGGRLYPPPLVPNSVYINTL